MSIKFTISRFILKCTIRINLKQLRTLYKELDAISHIKITIDNPQKIQKVIDKIKELKINSEKLIKYHTEITKLCDLEIEGYEALINYGLNNKNKK